MPSIVPTIPLHCLDRAYLLVMHGSRDPRPRQAIDRLADRLRDRLADSLDSSTPNLAKNDRRPYIETAQLELHPLPLSEQICQFADRAIARGYRRIQLIPLFLLEGVHVREDIPEQVKKARALVGDRLAIEMTPAIGSRLDSMYHLLAAKIDRFASRQWILLSHGSRREGGNRQVEELGKKLGVFTAYWSVSPTLEETIAQLRDLPEGSRSDRGAREIAIFPYFLFVGGMTEAIADLIGELSLKFSDLQFHLADPLGDSDSLAQIIFELMATCAA
ncbi:sirohydrochlorin chelatase [Oxynema aestuarii]|nr:sirohydrochlorin chelatase [Oxynema aestuarii]